MSYTNKKDSYLYRIISKFEKSTRRPWFLTICQRVFERVFRRNPYWIGFNDIERFFFSILYKVLYETRLYRYWWSGKRARLFWGKHDEPKVYVHTSIAWNSGDFLQPNSKWQSPTQMYRFYFAIPGRQNTLYLTDIVIICIRTNDKWPIGGSNRFSLMTTLTGDGYPHISSTSWAHRIPIKNHRRNISPYSPIVPSIVLTIVLAIVFNLVL